MQLQSLQPQALDLNALERAVKRMYEQVAKNPEADFHFELGRDMAERLGYSPRLLDNVPSPAIASFAGVGHHFDIADLRPGERVIDLGSGSGMDSFVAAQLVGPTGSVTGIDMTDAQREKAIALRDVAGGFEHVRFVPGFIEGLPFPDASFDCVVSNGVINLVADKAAVFAEAYRVLAPGGRLAISDIVTAERLPAAVTCDHTLWAACIGGAMHREDYQKAVYGAGFEITYVQPNPEYRFLSGRADRAADRFGVRSISLVATKR